METDDECIHLASFPFLRLLRVLAEVIFASEGEIVVGADSDCNEFGFVIVVKSLNWLVVAFLLAHRLLGQSLDVLKRDLFVHLWNHEVFRVVNPCVGFFGLLLDERVFTLIFKDLLPIFNVCSRPVEPQLSISRCIVTRVGADFHHQLHRCEKALLGILNMCGGGHEGVNQFHVVHSNLDCCIAIVDKLIVLPQLDPSRVILG